MKISKCNHCGNMATLLVDAGVPLVCCGEKMAVLQAGVTDAALEKHVPAVSVENGMMQVVVGEVVHPMTEEHLIQWILLVQGGKVQYAQLSATDEPKASFSVESGPYEVYEYCNLHGLWKTEGTV